MGHPAGGRGNAETGKSVTVDGNGAIYITGEISAATGDADFGSQTITNIEFGTDAFVSKLDSTGGFLWTRGFAGVASSPRTGDVYAWDVIADGAGGIYFTGDFRVTATIGPFGLTFGSGGLTGFLAHLDASGVVLSAQEFTHYGPLGDVGSDGSLYLTSAIFTDAAGEEFPTGQTLVSTPTADGSPSFDIFITKMGPGVPDIRSLIVSAESIVEGSALTLSAHGALDIGGRVARNRWLTTPVATPGA